MKFQRFLQAEQEVVCCFPYLWMVYISMFVQSSQARVLFEWGLGGLEAWPHGKCLKLYFTSHLKYNNFTKDALLGLLWRHSERQFSKMKHRNAWDSCSMRETWELCLWSIALCECFWKKVAYRAVARLKFRLGICPLCTTLAMAMLITTLYWKKVTI